MSLRARIYGRSMSAVALSACMMLSACDVARVDDQGTEVRVVLVDGGVATSGRLECYSIEQDGAAIPSQHGTAMASVILDAVARPCEQRPVLLRSIPVLVEDGSGANADAIADAIEAAIAWDADLVNISIDLRSGSDSLKRAVGEAEGEGVTIVAAAGNRMGMAAGYPAAYDGVVSVGAVDEDGSELWFTAIEEVDTFELGIGVPYLDVDGNTAEGVGTSFAAGVHTSQLIDKLLSSRRR